MEEINERRAEVAKRPTENYTKKNDFILCRISLNEQLNNNRRHTKAAFDLWFDEKKIIIVEMNWWWETRWCFTQKRKIISNILLIKNCWSRSLRFFLLACVISLVSLKLIVKLKITPHTDEGDEHEGNYGEKWIIPVHSCCCFIN